ncbi:MAG TPA: DUF6580 family putative transport protein [Kofleriaceae bacterium]|nr:DUF6580 family putative transport protein [Kofleriaceae bacterium]
MSTRFWFLAVMIIAAAAMRILPHPPNMTPVAAMAIFGGAHFTRRWQSFAVPLGAMVLSDAILELMFGWGFHPLLPVVYLTIAAIVGLGVWLRPRRRQPLAIAGTALAASTIFFVTTNFAVWAMGSGYPHTAAGLLACYTAAIPFYQWTMIGDLFYAAVLFGALAAAELRFPALAETR